MKGKAAVTDWSELIRAIAELVKALQWPLVALILAAFFKDEIRKLIRRFRKGKFMGAEAEFDAVVEKLEEGMQQEQQETKTKVIPQTASISVSPEGSKSKPPGKAIDMFEEEVRLTRAWDPQGAFKLLIREIERVARERAETWSEHGPMPYHHRGITGAVAYLTFSCV